MRFVTWNVKSLYGSDSITTTARELARYKLNLGVVQDVKLEKKGHCNSRGLYIFQQKRKRKLSIGNRIFLHHRIVSPVKIVEFVSHRVSYIVLRGCWFNVIVCNVHAPREEKIEDSKDSFMRN